MRRKLEDIHYVQSESDERSGRGVFRVVLREVEGKQFDVITLWV